MPTHRDPDNISASELQTAEEAGAFVDQQTLAAYFNVTLKDAAELMALRRQFRELAAVATRRRRQFQ